MDQHSNIDKWVTEPEFVEEGEEAQRGGYNLHKDMKRCEKNDQHLNFIPFKFFFGKESSTVFKIIEILGNLTVRISAFSEQCIKVNASGMLFRLVEIENLDYQRDHCLFFVIITAKHVISNDTDAKNATVEFFNYGDNRCDFNCARCIKVLASNSEGDFSEVLCMTTNRRLVHKIKFLLDFNHLKLAHRNNMFKVFVEARELNLSYLIQSDLNTFKGINTVLQHINHFDPKDELLNKDTFTYPLKFDFRNIEQLQLNLFIFEGKHFRLSNRRKDTTEIELLNRVFRNPQERKTCITLVENLFKFKCEINYLCIHICYPYGNSKQVISGKVISTKSFIGPYMFMENTPTCLECSGGPMFVVPRECLELNDEGEIQLDKICFLPHSKPHSEVEKPVSWRRYFDSSNVIDNLRLSSNEHSEIGHLLSDTNFWECVEELGKFQNLDEECAELQGKYQNLLEDYEKALGEFNLQEECDEALWELRNQLMFQATEYFESKHSGVNLLSKVCTLLNIIEILGNLTVRVVVFSGTPNEVAASGMLFRIGVAEILDDQPWDDLYFTIVIPNNLISTEEHVINATVECINCEDGDCDIKYASCVELLCSNIESDFSEVVCKTKDKMLAAKIKKLFYLICFNQAQKCGEIKKPNSQNDNIKKLDKVLGKINNFEMFNKLLDQRMESSNSDAHLPVIMCNPNFLRSRILKAKIHPYNKKKSEYLVDALWQDLNNMEKSYTNIVLRNLQESNPLMISSIEAVDSLFKDEQNDLCIHIGHPHGMSKQVTIGEIISTNTDTGYYTFMYNTPTCPGCSGGPVFVVPRECLQLNDNGEIQLDKIFVLPHSNAYKNEEKFSCNRSSSWMIYLDGSMNETLRLSLPDEAIDEIAKLLKDALPSMQ